MSAIPTFARLRQVCVLIALCAGAAAAQGPPPGLADDVETALMGIFKAIEANRLTEAFARTEALIAGRPNYRLAHLIKGDLLLARGRPIRTMGAAPNASPEQLRDLRGDALKGLLAQVAQLLRRGVRRGAHGADGAPARQ